VLIPTRRIRYDDVDGPAVVAAMLRSASISRQPPPQTNGRRLLVGPVLVQHGGRWEPEALQIKSSGREGDFDFRIECVPFESQLR
jgi:hypothetical protein